VNESLAAEGVAKEFEIVPLSALTTGKVVKLGARLGEVVRKGERLVELDPGPLVSALKNSQSQLDSSKEQLDLQTRRASVMEKLFEKGAVAQDELNAAVLNRLKAEQDVAKNEDAVVQATLNLAEARIDSPVSGVVTNRDTYVGTIVRAQTPIMTVAQTDPILVHAPYPEDKIRFIRLGQPAQLSFYAFPGEKYSGTVRWINPVVDNSTRLMTVHILVSNSDLKFSPGMRGIVWLNNDQTKVIRVPAVSLLSTRQDFAYVFIVDDGVARIREIRTGAYAEGYIEVKSGLKEGEQIVVVGQVGLSDNSKVRVFGPGN
jgi:membrane fusion protein (multidrug efflux system)